MKGILILAHGSRQKTTEDTLKEIVRMVKEQLNEYIIEIGYLEFSSVNIEVGLERLIEQGVTEIKVVPYFLFEGIHVREDIPEEINEFLKKHPNVNVTLGKTLGADKRLADILVDRVRELV